MKPIDRIAVRFTASLSICSTYESQVADLKLFRAPRDSAPRVLSAISLSRVDICATTIPARSPFAHTDRSQLSATVLSPGGIYTASAPTDIRQSRARQQRGAPPNEPNQSFSRIISWCNGRMANVRIKCVVVRVCHCVSLYFCRSCVCVVYIFY